MDLVFDAEKLKAISDWVRANRETLTLSQVNERMDRELSGLREDFEKRKAGKDRYLALKIKGAYDGAENTIPTSDDLENLQEFHKEVSPKDAHTALLFLQWSRLKDKHRISEVMQSLLTSSISPMPPGPAA